MQQFPEKQVIEDSDGNSPADWIYKFLPYWPLFALLVLISLFIAWTYLRYTLPAYESSATLLIKSDKQGSDPLEAFDIFNSTKIVENEIRILESKTLMQEVVKNLHLYAPVTVSGRLRDQPGYEFSPIIIEADNPYKLPNARKIYLNYDKGTGQLKIDDKIYPLNKGISTKFGNLKFLPNQKSSNYNEELTYYFSFVDVKAAAKNIIQRLSIKPSGKQSTVIDLSIIDEVPQRGEDILNELIYVYNQAAVKDKNILATNTLKFVEDRLEFVVNELDSVENKLQNYKSENKIVDVSSQGQIYLQTVAANDQKISDINLQLAVLDQVQNYVTGKGNSGGIVPATLGISDPILSNLLEKLSDFELQYAQSKKLVPENNPKLLALSDGIQNLKPGILENINSQRQNLLAGKKDLNSTNNQYSSMLRRIPEKERELLSISRQQAIKNNIYTFLLQKREDAALSFASTVADSRIIDNAESSNSPVSPKKSIIYLISVGIALTVGLGFVLLKDILSRTVQDKLEIEKFTNIPILGEIIFDRSKTNFVIQEGQRTFIAEQFRHIRTSLNYMGIDDTHKKIMITSSISGEGKSFIAINLGISLSLMGKKVIMIELDLRKPKLSEQFKIERNIGISNYLIGKAKEEEIIKSTEIDNLFLIPSGPIPPNPSELISNGRLVNLLNNLEASHDYVIIDTAPVNPVTDAFILSPLCNLTLFVIRHNYTPKIFIQKLEQYYRTNRFIHPAIIYNGIKSKGFGKYGYGYGYGYEYGYGYTEEENDVKQSWRKFLNL